jgi:hypothetical protein
VQCERPSKTKAGTPQAATLAASKIDSQIVIPQTVEIPKDLAAKIDFVAIATPLIRAGRRITPVHPMTKLGAMKHWNKHQITSIVELKKLAKYFPHHNVGCVGIAGHHTDNATGEEVGNDCFLDIDAEGELERIERETGETMPRTYTVCSRPDTLNWKKHFYFRQTPYSIRRFGKHPTNIQIKDLTRFDEKGNHPVLYDMRGIGGAAFVVGAGSVRADGQVYTVADDSPLADLPNWLTDWLLSDKARYKAEANQEHERDRLAKTKERAKYTLEQRVQMRKEGLPAGFDIFKKDTYEFLTWKARQLSSHGLGSSALEVALADVCGESCEGGTEYAASERGKATIHRIANDPALVRGHATFFYDRKEKKASRGKRLDTPPKSQTKQLVEVACKFPDHLPTKDAYAALGLTDSDADRTMAREVRKGAGFMTTNIGGVWHWSRISAVKNAVAQDIAYLTPSPLEKTENTLLRFETVADVLNFYDQSLDTLGDSYSFRLQRVFPEDGGGLAIELVPLEAAKEEEITNA